MEKEDCLVRKFLMLIHLDSEYWIITLPRFHVIKRPKRPLLEEAA